MTPANPKSSRQTQRRNHVASSGVLGEVVREVRDALTHVINAERSNRENRQMHTDNNIRAAHQCLIAALNAADSPNGDISDRRGK